MAAHVSIYLVSCPVLVFFLFPLFGDQKCCLYPSWKFQSSLLVFSGSFLHIVPFPSSSPVQFSSSGTEQIGPILKGVSWLAWGNRTNHSRLVVLWWRISQLPYLVLFFLELCSLAVCSLVFKQSLSPYCNKQPHAEKKARARNVWA